SEYFLEGSPAGCLIVWPFCRFRSLAATFMSQYADLEVDIEVDLAKYRNFAEELRPCIIDTVPFLNKAIREGKKILVEGANATMLDIDFGASTRVDLSTTCSPLPPFQEPIHSSPHP